MRALDTAATGMMAQELMVQVRYHQVTVKVIHCRCVSDLWIV